MDKTFENFTKPRLKTLNTTSFTADFVDGKFEFTRGNRFIKVPAEVVASLITYGDFYDNIDALLKINRDPLQLAKELADLMNQEMQFVTVKEASYKPEVGFVAVFLPDLFALNLRRTEPPRPLDDYAMTVIITSYRIDFQAAYDDLSNQFQRLLGDSSLEPAI